MTSDRATTQIIDLRSDTVTKPSARMREVMAQAEVGDDVYGEDPTVNRLQQTAATLLGKEAALFVPSGIMANQLCLRLHAKPGDEVIIDSRSHIVRYEHGAAAALAGIQLHWVNGTRGLLDTEQVKSAIRPKDPYNPTTALISLENTHNSGGGSVYPLQTIQQIRAIAMEYQIPMHLDGARLFNAVTATGTPAADYARHFETVSFCLSKGLGAPVGSLIVTDSGRIASLRPLRRMYGGGMRQAGILAAAGLYALHHNIGRLKEDHAHARQLASRLERIPAVSIDVTHVETNIVIFDVKLGQRSAEDVMATLRSKGLLINAVGRETFRAVTHLDVSSEEIERAGEILASVLKF
jgi:threonine aldolase